MNLTSAFKKASEAGRSLNVLDPGIIIDALLMIASETEKSSGLIISENEKDLALMDKADPKYDRLLLNRERIAGIVSDIRNVAKMTSPLGRILSESLRPNGLIISRITVPFGVIG